MITLLRRCLALLGAGHRGRWVAVIGLALLAAGMEVFGALLVVWLLVGITTDRSGFDVPLVGDLRTLLPGVDATVLGALIGVAVAVFFVVRGLVMIGQVYVQYRVAENAGARLAARLLEGYLAMPHAFHLRRNSAELVRNAYDNVQHFVRDALVPSVKLVSHSLIILGLAVVLLVVSPVPTLLVVVVLGPVVWVLLRIVHPRVKRFGQVSQDRSRTSLQTLHESLAGWRDITVLGRQAHFVERFRVDRRRLARARYFKGTAKELPRVVLETCLVLAILAFLGLSLVVGGGALAALPVLGLFGYAAIRLQPSINEVLLALNSLKFVQPGVDHLYDDLAMFTPVHPEPEVAATPLVMRRELRLDGVGFRYEGAAADALSRVDLVVRRGEFLGVVGPTGGGKSTLVDVMLGLLEPTSGRVEIDGTPLSQRRREWFAALGVVPQTIFLADTTLRRNIALGLADDEIDDVRVVEALELAQMTGFVAALPDGLDTMIGEHGVRVSGGQRQRLAIARALYRRPSVIFFDEGTSALDNSTESQLMTALAALRGERTIVAVAHRLSTVHSCDRVALIEGGRVRDVAPFADLAARHGDLLVAGS